MMTPFFLAILLLTGPEASEESAPKRTQVEETVDGADVGNETTAALSGAGEAMRIVSRRSEFDRDSAMSYFEGDVVVNYFPDYRLDCDRLYVFFKDRSFDRLIAEGHVAVSNDMRFGFCDRATFLRDEGEIELVGGESIPKATILEKGANVIRGKRIKFWLTTDQVEIEGSEITVNKGKNKGDFKGL